MALTFTEVYPLIDVQRILLMKCGIDDFDVCPDRGLLI